MKEKINYTVLMSVYKKEKPEWLETSIKSMLDQTEKPNEFLIIEDGPLTIELENVINKYFELFPTLFKVIKIKENGGLGPALNLGVINSKNEIIVRMDSDDYSIPTRCERELDIIRNNKDIDIIGSCVGEFVDRPENVISYRNVPETHKEILNFSKRRNPFAHPSVLVKKSKIIAAGNYQSYPYCEDYDLWTRMIQNGAKCYNIQSNLVFMRISADFYARRGGVKYLKSILKFKKELYNKKYCSLKDYIISSFASAVVCVMPNKIRDLVYKKMLRKGSK